jgi:hypothetical protein
MINESINAIGCPVFSMCAVRDPFSETYTNYTKVDCCSAGIFSSRLRSIFVITCISSHHFDQSDFCATIYTPEIKVWAPELFVSRFDPYDYESIPILMEYLLQQFAICGIIIA